MHFKKKGRFKHIYESSLFLTILDNVDNVVGDNEPDLTNEPELVNEPDLANEQELVALIKICIKKVNFFLLNGQRGGNLLLIGKLQLIYKLWLIDKLHLYWQALAH